MDGSAHFEVGPTPAAIAAVYAPNWAVTDWYIDGVIGDDANAGTTAGTPLRTGAELARRLGPYALWGQSVTVHVLANGMTDGLILKGSMQVAGTHLDIIGTPIQIADAGTIATYAARDHAIPIADQISTTLIPDWTPYQWKRIRITGGTRTGGVAWVATSNPAGVGVATARINKPYRPNATSITTQHETITPAVNDPLTIEELPTIPLVSVVVDGPLNQSATPVLARRQVGIFDVDVTHLELDTQSSALATYQIISGCRFSSIYTYPGNTNKTTLGSAGGCMVYSRDGSVSTIVPWPNCALQNCLVGDCAAAQIVQAYANCIAQSTLFQGIAFYIPSICIFQFADIQIFDVPTAIDAALLVTGRVNYISGSGNAGYGIGVQNKALLTFSAHPPNVKGAISDCRLASAPAIPLTTTQLNQPSDYAQSGTATLGATGAGYVDVTVPWWDPTSQRLTVSVKDLLGTTGVISCPSANRTNTGFRIQSTNVLDVSVVDWQISPLGRNVFISQV